MSVLLPLGILILTVVGMECFSWFMHKFLFHGPLWFIHKSHHQERHGFFELNDVFSLLFAAVSLYFMFAYRDDFAPPFWIGAGISLYGIIYFVFHDWFIHNRFQAFKTTNRYLLGIRRAHKIHHKSTKKQPSEEFGLLWASRKYFRKD